MKLTHLHPPPAVRWIVRTLETAGYETWAVGGAVRDELLGIPSMDWDFATRARPGQVRRAFRRTVPVGIEHGTVGVLARDGTLYEVTTFRKDVETFGRRAVVEFADTLDDDLARRDFTINAVAWHPLRDELHDPFGGVDDLREGLLRTVGSPGDRFAEDFLRILRALRFAGRFGLRVEEDTWQALSAAVHHIPSLSPERVREELMKVLESDERPSGSLSLYAASGALEVAFPELRALVAQRWDPPVFRADCRTESGGLQGPLDAWSAALLAADHLPPRRPFLRLAALLMDTGVAAEPAVGGVDQIAGGAPSTGGKGAAGPGAGTPARDRAARRAAALLIRLRFSNAQTDRVTALVRVGPELPAPGSGRAEVRRWLSEIGPERFPDVVRVAGARARVMEATGIDGTVQQIAGGVREARTELRRSPPLSVGDLALDGRDLIGMGLRPGPRFGEILERLLERVLEDPSLNRPEPLAGLVRAEVAPDLFPGDHDVPGQSREEP